MTDRVPAQGVKILVVDDGRNLADNIAEVLASWGHQAEVATSAEEGLARLRVDPAGAQLLLTDYRLPGATGADLIGVLRGLGNKIPALIITAYHDGQIDASAMSASGDDVLSRPVDFARLLSWVEGSRAYPAHDLANKHPTKRARVAARRDEGACLATGPAQ